MAITAGKINLFRGCNYKWIKWTGCHLVCKNCGGIRKIKLQSGHSIFAFSSGYITPPYRWCCYSFKIMLQYYLRTVRLVYRVYASHNSSHHMTAPVCLIHWMICITWESDLAEVHVDVLAGFLVQLSAANLLREVSDADGIARVQLLHQEITAGLHHAVDLIHHRSVHHVDNALLSDRDACRVGELYQAAHYLSIQITRCCMFSGMILMSEV